jgi:two-component system, LuxR family, sensor kinase FixL
MLPADPKLMDEPARRLSAIADLAGRATSGLPTEELNAVAVEQVADILSVPLVRIVELIPSAEACLPQATFGPWQEASNTPFTTRARVSLAGFTLSEDRPVIVEDLASESRFNDALLEAHDVVSCVAVPIPGSGRPSGILAAYTTEPRAFQPEDVHFLRVIAFILNRSADQASVDAALRDAEAKAQAILETTVDGIITIDEFGRIISFNSAAERIFLYTADEVIGQNVRVLMPEPYKEEHDGYIRSYRESGRRAIIGIGREVTGLRKDGTTFPMDLAVSEVNLSGRRIFTGIIRDITVRRQLEKEILAISDQERRRIGQDLHDGLGQMLTGIGLISRNLARRLDASGQPEAEEVAEIARLVREADEMARNLARGLVPVELEDTGLRNALIRLAAASGKLLGITCTVEDSGSIHIPETAVANHLYRIAQEAVSNAVRHGEARNVTISLVQGREHLRLRIVDDGKGFPDVPPDDGGMGIRIMHYRARIIGASLEIRPAPNGGTMVICTRRHDRTAPHNELTTASSDHVQDSHR